MIVTKTSTCLLLLLARSHGFQYPARSQRTALLSFEGDHMIPRSSVSGATVLGARRFPILPTGTKPLFAVQDEEKTLVKVCSRFRRWIRKALFAAALFFSVSFSTPDVAWARKSGGRMGGSFKSHRAPISRPSPRLYSRPPYSQPRYNIRYYPRSPPRVILNPAHTGSFPVLVQQRPVSRIQMSDVVMFAGYAGFIAWVAAGVYNEYYRGNGAFNGLESPLGPGVSVVSVTAALNVPNRDSPSSILSRLSRIAAGSTTDIRSGVQKLISETALELLRQERSIVSVGSYYKHFKRIGDAERDFNTLSTRGRSKFDEETVSNFGGVRDFIETASTQDDSALATAAVVTLNLCIEGDSTKVSTIRNRVELRSALLRIASDSQIDSCLLSGEVLWIPESRAETVTSEDVYVDYPDLYPLLD